MAKGQKYRVFAAVSEGWRAVRKNSLSIVVAFVSTLILALFAILLLVGIAFVIFLQFDELTPLAASLAAIGIVAGFASLLFIQAFVNNVTSLAFADGLKGRRSDVGVIIKQGFQAAPRVAFTYLSLFLVIVAPLFLVGALTAILSIGGLEGFKLVLVVLGITAWLCWAVLAVLRYALVPFVALFEETSRPMEALRSSYRMMQNGGMWFLIKGILLVFAVNILLSILTGSANGEPASSWDNPAFAVWSFVINVVSIVVSIVGQAAFVAFYFNRRQTAQRS